MIIASQTLPTMKDPTLQDLSGTLTVNMASIDEPPPYIQYPQVHSVPPPPRRPVPPVPRTTSDSFRPPLPKPPPHPVTNHVFVKTRHEPIQGVFHIDPDIQTVALDKEGATAVDRRDFLRKHRQKHRHHSRKSFKKKRANAPIPNAIFQAKQGSIKVDLAIVASPMANPSRTLIQAATKHGHVEMNVHSIHPQRNLNIEVKTQHGDVLLFIPRSFSGYIQAYCRHGHLVFLPHLMNSMTPVSRLDRDVQVVVGGAVNDRPTTGTEWTGDTIHVASKHGNVYIGYIAEDTKPVEEPGFWKKVVDFFHTKH